MNMKRSRFFHRHLYVFGMQLLIGSAAILPLSAQTHFDLAPSVSAPVLQNHSGNCHLQSADINGDGKYDLVVSYDQTTFITIFLNTTENDPAHPGTFNEGSNISFEKGNATSIAIADMNRDAKADIILADPLEKSIVILLNHSSGNSLHFDTPLFIGCEGIPVALAACDLNVDGAPDLIATCGRQLMVFKNNSSAGGALLLDAALKINMASPVLSLKCGDMDGDGNADIVAGCSDKTVIMQNTTAWGSASITLSKPVNHYTAFPAFAMEIGDMDGDFKPEIITANWPQSGFTILHNSAQGGKMLIDTAYTFETATSGGITLGDFDMDGKWDVATTAAANEMQATEIFRNISPGEGSIQFESPSHINSISHQVIAADFDGDGKDDFAGINEKAGAVNLFVHDATQPLTKLSVPETYCGEDGLVWISWVSTQDSNNLLYTIEKTTDGSTFVPVSEVQGKTNNESSYSVCDKNPSLNVAYYRITVTDNKGASQTTTLIPLTPCESIVSDFTCVFPNPVHDVMNFQFSVKAATGMHFEIMDAQMNVQLEKTENISAGTRTYTLDVAKLPSGSYLLAVRFGNLPPKVCRFEKL